MLREEIVNFLQRTPPFNILDRETLAATAENVSIEFYPRGFTILRQNGPPCATLLVIKKGGVKVFVESDEGEEVLIDYRSEGDAFGFVSLLSGDKSRANVVAVEDTICYILPKEMVLSLLGQQPLLRDFFMKSFFVNFIDKTYSEMRSRSFSFGEGDKLLYTTPVRNLISKEVVTAPPGATVREAAQSMSQQRISSLIVSDEQGVPVGIVTDRDLRDKVLAKGLDPSLPVSRIMSQPYVRVDAGEVCFEALMKMIKYNIHHLLVVESGRLVGVVTNHDFMLLQGTSPLALLKDIEGQKSLDGLVHMGERIYRIISLLVKEGVKALNITRVIAELNDRLLAKVVDLTIRHAGPPPAPFAVVVYGGEGRKELTFKPLVDCAVVYEPQKTPIHEREAAQFAERLLGSAREALKKCGLPSFDLQPFGPGSRAYGNVAEWERAMEGLLLSGDLRKLAMASRFLDLRGIYGEIGIAESLREKLFYRVRNHQDLMGNMVRLAVRQKSPIGFFRTFVVERGGEHKDRLNLREKGVMPLVHCLRALAVYHDVGEASTVDRLAILSRTNPLLAELREDITSAFDFLLHIRIEDQIKKKQFGEPADDFIDPDKLSVLEKKTLKEVFQIVSQLQEEVVHHFEKAGVAA